MSQALNLETFEQNAGSYRDPKGHVFEHDSQIFRTITQRGREDYELLANSSFAKAAVEENRLIGFEEVDVADVTDIYKMVRHPRLQFISYPYEWCFSALKDAALFHLDIQRQALQENIALSDSTAYNIQFVDTKPIFIDLLSFEKYQEGSIWQGHRQFCEQFVNPLLLYSKLGIPFNDWYKGAPEGISAAQLSKLLKLKNKFSWNVFTHVVLQAKLQSSSSTINKDKVRHSIKLPKSAYLNILNSMHGWVNKLKLKGQQGTVWEDYSDNHSYASDEEKQKVAFIAEYSEKTQPGLIWDLGCNSGEYSEVALKNGSTRCIGFDFDQGALERAYQRGKSKNLNFFPVYLDVTNPSTNLGWRQSERKGLAERACADGIIALALIHHIAISKNVPLLSVIEWLVSLAPSGVIEFVPKQDPMVKQLLALREDIFDNYTEGNFEKILGEQARIVKKQTVSRAGRTLYWYER
jgi:ribosomal protein L11 methylase PrmA